MGLMGFVGDVIYKSKQRYIAQRNLATDIKSRVARGEIKSLKDVNARYERGIKAHSYAVSSLTKEKVAETREEEIYKQKIKEAKNLQNKATTIKSARNFGNNLASAINRNPEALEQRTSAFSFGSGSGLQIGNSPIDLSSGNTSPFVIQRKKE